jgi:ribonuclease HII
MRDYHEQWPCYGFDQHKGYGTPQHQKALKLHGISPIHRRSFEPVKNFIPVIKLQLELFES